MHREARLFGLFLLMLGLAALVAGTGALLSGELPREGLSCKAICGLSLLVSEVLGIQAGAAFGGGLLLTLGAVAALLGWRIFVSARRH